MGKRIKNYLFAISIVFIVIAVYLIRESAAEFSYAAVKDLEPINKNVNGINMMIDPRIEVLAALQSVSGYNEKYHLLTDRDFSYKNDMIKYFSKFSKHEAVKLFDTMSSINFAYDAPPYTMLYLSNPLSLKAKQDFDEQLKSRIGEGSLNKFSEQIKNFAVKTKFNEYFNKHQEFYKSVLDKNSKLMGDEDYIGYLEQYYGMKQKSYNIILAPMFAGGGYGPRIKSENGNYDVYSIQGTNSVENDIPVMGEKESFRYVALHEFSHSFVNPLTEQYESEVQSSSKLFDPISDKMKKQAYTNWETCVNEHIVRAVVARLAYIHAGKQEYDRAIYLEKANGFLYIETLTNKLEEYENNREKYKSFKDFYPELLDVFKSLN